MSSSAAFWPHKPNTKIQRLGFVVGPDMWRCTACNNVFSFLLFSWPNYYLFNSFTCWGHEKKKCKTFSFSILCSRPGIVSSYNSFILWVMPGLWEHRKIENECTLSFLSLFSYFPSHRTQDNSDHAVGRGNENKTKKSEDVLAVASLSRPGIRYL